MLEKLLNLTNKKIAKNITHNDIMMLVLLLNIFKEGTGYILIVLIKKISPIPPTAIPAIFSNRLILGLMNFLEMGFPKSIAYV